MSFAFFAVLCTVVVAQLVAQLCARVLVDFYHQATPLRVLQGKVEACFPKTTPRIVVSSPLTENDVELWTAYMRETIDGQNFIRAASPPCKSKDEAVE